MRLPEEFLEAVEASSPYTSVRGIHPNWRVARYQEGQTFPAHLDQADSVMVERKERARQRFTSSHTLLINLTQPDRDFQGGATRFFLVSGPLIFLLCEFVGAMDVSFVPYVSFSRDI